MTNLCTTWRVIENGMKTVFFVFSAQTVFKNFFFFEGSLYDRIRAHAEAHDTVRWVFVLSEAGHVYDEFFEKNPAPPSCVFAYVSFSKERTLAQKILRFFYSYFVYTGTTAVMATIGIRPDEPPAGGRFKKFLGPVKWLISKTFGRSRFFRERVVPGLYYRVFSGRPFARLFEEYKPDLVFVPHVYGPFDTALLAEARLRGVRSVGMISNWDHFDKYYLPFKPDLLLAQSEQIKRFAVRHQWYDASFIELVGYPYFDFMARCAGQKTREKVLADLNMPPDSRFTLYVSSSAYCRDEPEIVEEMLDWIGKGVFGKNYYLVIRPYIGTRPADREYDKIKFNRFSSHPAARIFGEESWDDVRKSFDFVNLISQADQVLVLYSTVAMEAAALDRPIIGPAFDGWHTRPLGQSIRRFKLREHFRDAIASGALKPAHSFAELRAIMEAYHANPGLDKEKRERLVEDLCWRVDGKSTERVFSVLLRELGVSSLPINKPVNQQTSKRAEPISKFPARYFLNLSKDSVGR